MCKFFSFCTDPEKHGGKFFYFNKKQRMEQSFPDSHSKICFYFDLEEDRINKYEYNFETKALFVDQQNSEVDDRVKAQKWVESLKLHDIIKQEYPFGTILVFKPLKKILELNKKEKILYGWDTAMERFLDENLEFEYTPDSMIDGWTVDRVSTVCRGTWSISTSMLEPKH